MPNDCAPIVCTCTTLFDTSLPRLTVFGGARTPKGAAVLVFWGSGRRFSAGMRKMRTPGDVFDDDSCGRESACPPTVRIVTDMWAFVDVQTNSVGT